MTYSSKLKREGVVYIYGLRDPNTEQIRYIGKASDPQARFYQHMGLYPSDVNQHKKAWLRSLISNNQKPDLVILEEISSSIWEDRERWWIRHGKENNWPLTNLTGGGANNYQSIEPNLYSEMIEALAYYLDEGEEGWLKWLTYDELHFVLRAAGNTAIPLTHQGLDPYVPTRIAIYRCLMPLLPEIQIKEKGGEP